MGFNTSPTAGISLASLKSWRRPAAFFLLVSNLAVGLYTGLIHQRGPLDTMSHLGTLCDINSISSPPQPDVLFLMPCHSTPFYRYRSTSPEACTIISHSLLSFFDEMNLFSVALKCTSLYCCNCTSSHLSLVTDAEHLSCLEKWEKNDFIYILKQYKIIKPRRHLFWNCQFLLY